MEKVDRLTERQKDCLRLVGAGFTSKEIAPMLGISPATIDNHIRAALEVLQVAGRAEAARMLAGSSQRLISQPDDLAGSLESDAIQSTASEHGHAWFRRFISPLGGQRNALSPRQKIFAILSVAVISLASVIILALAVAVLLWLFR